MGRNRKNFNLDEEKRMTEKVIFLISKDQANLLDSLLGGWCFSNRSEVIRKALGLLQVVVEREKNGEKLFFENKEGKQQEVMFII